LKIVFLRIVDDWTSEQPNILDANRPENLMRKNTFMLAVASLALIAGSSFGYEGSDGSTYIATQNAHGAALKSAN